MKRILVLLLTFIVLIAMSGCNEKIENPENFSNKNYTNFTDVNNITKYMSIDSDMALKMFEDNSSLVFAYKDSNMKSEEEFNETYQKYFASLNENGFEIYEENTKRSNGELVFFSVIFENDTTTLTITVVSNHEKFKKSRMSIENINKIDQENIIVELEKK